MFVVAARLAALTHHVAVGRVMEKTLRESCGIETVRQLYEKRAEVYFLFKPASANFLLRASIGYSEGQHRESTEDEGGEADEALHRKGISHERTFSPTSSWSDMCTKLEGITLSLVQDLRERTLRPKTITLKVKLANFDILSRATTRDVALFQNHNNRHSAQDLVDIVIQLLKEAKREHDAGGASKKTKIAAAATKAGPSSFSVRLLGVRCSNFQSEDNQLSLDRFRVTRGLDDTQKPPSNTQQPNISSTAALRISNTSPVANPYISPKSMSPQREKPGENRANSKRALYKSSTAPETKPSGLQPSETVSIQCPICNTNFHSSKHDNAVINAHIDACLNATTVKQLAKQETECADERARKKKRRLADFFAS